VDSLQQIELKREVAGTSRIEGAEFTDRELDAAMKESPEQLFTRSQKQAAAAVRTYRWIATIPPDLPLSAELICEIHRRIITNADDDHAAPGRVRREGDNVNFGAPRHRGADGGEESEKAFTLLTEAIQRQYPEHDPIIQALAVHYHLAAMHPFQDGNGRTARAVEALLMQRAGLRDSSFIAMSNYYYDEKSGYLAALAEVRQKQFDLTPFLSFALKGIISQSQRLLTEISSNISKALYRNLAMEFFGRLKSARKMVLAKRQLEIIDHLLEVESMEIDKLMKTMRGTYGKLKNPIHALVRDLVGLKYLGAIKIDKKDDGKLFASVRLQWPTEVTETEFFRKIKELPKAKTLSFFN
jgi:Fic family protein